MFLVERRELRGHNAEVGSKPPPGSDADARFPREHRRHMPANKVVCTTSVSRTFAHNCPFDADPSNTHPSDWP